MTAAPAPGTATPCQSCGACCAYSRDWPRFSTEDEVELSRIPPALIAADQLHMRCDGDRCQALAGEIGRATACTIYAVRPHVCRACEPGDAECRIARARFQLATL